MYCQHCGNELSNPNAIICTKCGCGTAKAGAMHGSSPAGLKEGWNVGLMILFCILAFLCPLVGWIMGGLNLNKATCSEGRKQQAIALIVVACIGAMMFGLLTNGNVDLDKVAKFFNVDVTAKNSDGDTPLHLAVWRNDRKRVGYLLTKGADVNAKNLYGKTPLHWAALWNRSDTEVLKCLIACGADVNAKDTDGRTPLDWAKTEENKDFLRAAGGKSGSDLGSE